MKGTGLDNHLKLTVLIPLAQNKGTGLDKHLKSYRHVYNQH